MLYFDAENRGTQHAPLCSRFRPPDTCSAYSIFFFDFHLFGIHFVGLETEDRWFWLSVFKISVSKISISVSFRFLNFRFHSVF